MAFRGQSQTSGNHAQRLVTNIYRNPARPNFRLKLSGKTHEVHCAIYRQILQSPYLLKSLEHIKVGRFRTPCRITRIKDVTTYNLVVGHDSGRGVNRFTKGWSSFVGGRWREETHSLDEIQNRRTTGVLACNKALAGHIML